MSFKELQSLKWKSEKKLKFYRNLIKDPEKYSRDGFKKKLKDAISSVPLVNETAKLLITLSSCVFIGFLFFITMTIKSVMYPGDIGTFVGLAVLSLIFLIQFLPAIKAIILVAIPALVTSQLRAIILIVLVTWAFQVPAMNIAKNIQLTSTTVICVETKVKAQLSEVKARAGENLRTVPVEAFRRFMKKAMAPFEKIRVLIRKVNETISKMMAYQRELIQKIKKMLETCNEDARLPYYRCVETVDKMYYDCLENNYPFICAPVGLLRPLCTTTRIMTIRCEWPAYLKKSLEETVSTVVKAGMKKAGAVIKDTSVYQLYASKRDMVNGTIHDSKGIEINFTRNYENDNMFAINFGTIKKKLRAEVASLEDSIKFIIHLLNITFFPIYLWPYVSATLYVIRFYFNPKYDNYFVSKSLEHVDSEKSQKGQPSILPLLPAEKSTIIATTNISFSSKEKPYFLFTLVMTIISAIVPAVLVTMDLLLYKLMDETYEFFNTNVSLIETPNHYEMKVAGKGFMQEMLASLLEIFQPLNQRNRDKVWRECFEEPSPPDFLLFQLMFLMFCFAVILCVFQVYAKRLRHLIAEKLFSQKVRKRALKLYTKLLEGRSNVIKEISNKVVKQNVADDDKPHDLEQTHTCVRCCKSDLKAAIGAETRVCVNCNSFYCADCFTIRLKCVHCEKVMVMADEEINFYVNSSGSDTEEEVNVVVKANKEETNK